jgi:prolyl-tRNA synthetase
MASQNPTDAAASGAAAPTTLPDRTQNPADNQAGESKNAAKKAEKAAKLAAAKAEKAAKHAAGVKTEGKKEAKKAPKKKVDGAALIGIDASKEENFPDWYQQVLTKGKNGNFNRLNSLLMYLQEICWTTMMCRAASS